MANQNDRSKMPLLSSVVVRTLESGSVYMEIKCPTPGKRVFIPFFGISANN